MAKRMNHLRYYLLFILLALVVAVSLLVYFFLHVSTIIFLSILGGGILLGLVGFASFQILWPPSTVIPGWSDPVINEKKAREIIGIKAPQVPSNDRDFLSDTGRVDEADLAGEFLQMGRLLLKSERYSEAREAFIQATRQDPGNSKIYNYLGITCGRLNLYEEAIDAYNKAIALDYDYASAHFNLASVYEQISDTENAMTQWQRYLEIGQVVGEREDMLDRARDRLKVLGKKTDKMKIKPQRQAHPENESTD